MNILSVNTLCGLYNMLYNKDDNLENIRKKIAGHDNNVFFNINNLFWSQILNEEIICKTIKNFVNISVTFSELSIQEQYVIHAPDIFIDKVIESKKNITISNIDEETLFAYIETLNIFCYIYNKLLPTNFVFSIDEGFHRSSNSAKEMLEHCLLEYSNPYLDFILKSVMPFIQNYKPDIIWMQGIPNIASFAIAKLAKMHFPNVHISVTNHSTEYYSLNKIKDNLLQNKCFFDCFDSVILNNNIGETKQKIIQCLNEDKNLTNVPNLLLKTEHISDNIAHLTDIQISYPKYDFELNCAERNNIINIRLFPKNHCYWNRCTFCGINNKYLDNSKEWNIRDAWIQLEYLFSQNIKYFWSIDEAIPPHVLFDLAKKINNKNYNFKWHTRSRLDIDWLNEEIIKELANSGLVQIRLGLESVTLRILELMNKHSECETIIKNTERIVKIFSKYNIRVHFPAIIGFPTETLYERDETINFLKYLKDNYPLFSYNVNVLEIDLSSKLYMNWDKYNITSIKLPCSANCFLGNIVEWYEPIVHSPTKSLEDSRENAMRYQYPWYPPNATTKPHIFYRLYESGRYMLYSRIKLTSGSKDNKKKDLIIKKNSGLVSWSSSMGTYFTYNPDNHHFYECSNVFYELLNNNECLLIDDDKYIETIIELIEKKFVKICERR